MTISSFSLAEFGLLKFYRISVLAANSLFFVKMKKAPRGDVATTGALS